MSVFGCPSVGHGGPPAPRGRAAPAAPPLRFGEVKSPCGAPVPAVPREPPPGGGRGLGKATLSGVRRPGLRAARARSRRSLRPGRNHTTEEKQ
ncbi:hypothetical protein GCM10009602_19030 [Nocardiopsis tropica]